MQPPAPKPPSAPTSPPSPQGRIQPRGSAWPELPRRRGEGACLSQAVFQVEWVPALPSRSQAIPREPSPAAPTVRLTIIPPDCAVSASAVLP